MNGKTSSLGKCSKGYIEYKLSRFIFSSMIVVICGALAFATPPKQQASAQDKTSPGKSSLTAEIGIGTGLENRELIGQADAFDVSDGTIVGWTLVTGAVYPTKIFHRWHFNGRLISSIPLSVTSKKFRTFSRQTVSNMTGDWKLDVVGPDETVLDTKDFIVNDKRFFSPPDKPGSQDPYQVIFTTGTTELGEPTNDLREITLDEPVIHVLVKSHLYGNPHPVRLMVFDGAGTKKIDKDFSLELKDDCYISFACDISSKDAPGLWQFLIYVDGVQIKDTLLVYPAGSAVKVSAVDRATIVSTSPDDRRPLQVGKIYDFVVNVDYNLHAEDGFVGLYIQQGERWNSPDSEVLVSETKPVSKGKGEVSFKTKLTIPESNSLLFLASLQCTNENRPRASDILVFKVTGKQ